MRLLFIFIFALIYLNAQTQVEQETRKNRSIEIDKSKTITKKTYNNATNDSDSSNWNLKDWEKHSGADESSIGNTQMQLQSNFNGASDSFSLNPNSMQTQTVQQNYSNDPALTAFSNNLVNDVVSNTISHNSSFSPTGSTTKCYIARDIPIRYQCSYTGLMYGGDIDSNGSEAKSQCEDECYEQYTSVEIEAEGSHSDIVLGDISLKTSEADELPTYYKEIITSNTVNSELVINNLSFKYDVTSEKEAYVTITHLDYDGVYTNIVKAYRLTGSGEKTLPINVLTKEIEIKVYASQQSTVLDITDIRLSINSGRYICPLNQDISNKNTGNFAYLCPSGRTKTFNIGYKSYTICEDYGIVGDNLDGTYSTKASAEATCKKNYTCKMDVTAINTSMLQTFREGCIQGQANCELDTCKKLRLTNATILNENVFDAGIEPTQTIINQNQVQGVSRPRVLLRTDLDFQVRTAEELKDEAYQDMIQNNKYAISTVKLEDNTDSSSTYQIGMAGTGNQYMNSAIRSLYWVYKPDAFSIDTNVKKYALFEVIVKKPYTNASGNKEYMKDRILYLKVNNSDTLKPFARQYNYANDILVDLGGGKFEYKTNFLETAVWKYESFNTSSNTWYPHSSSLIAEYYDSSVLTLNDNPFLRESIFTNIAEMIYSFQGLVRSVTKNGPIETKNYSGNFDGTGETVAKITVYPFYINSSNSLIYSKVVEELNNNNLKAIYDNLSYNTYPKVLKNDNGDFGGDVQMYLYGKIDSKTGYARVFPKTEDVGKSGFIYIFAVEE